MFKIGFQEGSGSVSLRRRVFSTYKSIEEATVLLLMDTVVIKCWSYFCSLMLMKSVSMKCNQLVFKWKPCVGCRFTRSYFIRGGNSVQRSRLQNQSHFDLKWQCITYTSQTMVHFSEAVGCSQGSTHLHIAICKHRCSGVGVQRWCDALVQSEGKVAVLGYMSVRPP